MAAVSFTPPALLGAYARELDLPQRVALLADPGRAAYAAFGFGRASFHRVWLDPRVWRRYAGLIARGRRPRPPAPEQDPLQLGGDVLLAPDGSVAWLHRSAGPEDRPSLTAVLDARRRLAAG